MDTATFSLACPIRPPAGIPCNTDEAARRAFAGDASGKAGSPPFAILRPTSTADIQTIVRWAQAAKTGLVPVSSSAGPRRRGDTVCARSAAVVDLSGMKGILNVDGPDAVAIVEAGVTFPELDTALRPHCLRSLKPLLPRESKSVLASYLEREPTTVPHLHWDSADPLVAMEVVFGTGDVFRTGSASLPGTLEENLARGNRQLISFGPGHTDFGRVIQGSQGALAIVSWASIYCERLPALQIPMFATADSPEPVVELCYRLLWRRAGSQVYIVNALQLASMLAADAREFQSMAAALPRWVLFFELTAPDYFPEESMAYQRADLEADARRAGVLLCDSLAGGVTAAAVSALRETPLEAPYKSRAAAVHEEVFCLSQLSRVNGHLQALATHGITAADIGIYLQPLVQGVNAHCEWTVWGSDPVRARRAARTAAEALAASGGFFSRPCHPWADLSFASDPTIVPLLRKTKAIFDPAGVLQPQSQALGFDTQNPATQRRASQNQETRNVARGT